MFAKKTRNVLLTLTGLMVFLPADTTVAKPLFYRRVVALCFGVDTYDSDFGSLSTAHADAERIAHVFRERFGYETIVPDESQNTRQGIRQQIQSTSSELREDDALIVYFSGHGVAFSTNTAPEELVFERVGFLVPYGVKLPFAVGQRKYSHNEYVQWNARCLNMREFVRDLTGLEVRHVLLIVDSCCSGFLVNRGLATPVEIANLFTRKSRVVLSATDQQEKALPQIFTASLIEILEKHSRQRNVVSVTDVFEEVRSEVPGRAEGLMTPRMGAIGGSRGEFLFFPLGIRQERIQRLEGEIALAIKRPDELTLGKGFPLLEGVIQRVRQRSGQRTTMSELLAAVNAPNYWYGTDAERQLNRWRDMRREFHQNASLGDPLAMAGLHFCYAKGLGETSQKADLEEVFRWAQETNLVEGSKALGKFLLSRCYRHGWGTQVNELIADELLSESATEGSVLGQIALAERLLKQGAPNGLVRVRELLQQDDSKNIANAVALMADANARGDWGIQQNLQRAVELYRSIFSDDYVWPCVVLYDAYGAGLPGYPPRDRKRSLDYLRKGAEAGVAAAQYHLAIELSHLPNRRRILELPRNAAEGRQWLELAVRQNHADALLVKAQLLADGTHPGFPANADQAKAALEAAVKQELPEATSTQGWWYLDKPEMYPRDERKAMQLLTRAARMNDAFGCALLGEMYEKGLGLDLRVTRFQMHRYTNHAMHWYMKAMENGGNQHAETQLKQFAGLYRLEMQGILYDRTGMGPTEVIRYWKRDFPDTEASFRRQYLNQ